MGEESIVTAVTEVTEMTGEQPNVPTESISEIMDNSVMETEISENVPLEHTSETEVPADAEINNDDIISSIVANAVSQSLEEAGVSETETVQTEVSVFSEAEKISETSAEVIESVVAEEIQTEAVSEVIQETEAVTEAVTETVQPSGNVGSLLIQNPAFIAVPAVIAVLAGAMAFVKKRSKKTATDDEDAPMSARDRDAVRLAADKPDKKNGKKAKKDKKDREKKNLSKKVLSTVPYQKVLSDDIFFLGKKMYSKAYTFDDINFNLADEEQQYMYLERYIEFLGILDDTVDCQICCWNSRLNMEEFKKATLMPQKADALFDYRYEFNSKVLEANIRKGQNAVQKHMYITLTIKAPDEETAVRRFRTLDITATNTFNCIGNTALRALTSQERIEMLRDFFVGADEMTVPVLTEEDFAKGREKLYCSPDYFDFKKDYFMFNDKYAKVLYIREYPSTATSDVLTGLLGTGIEIMVTTNIETYDSAEARKLVQHQITAVDTDMAKREVKAAQHGNFSSQMPQRIKNQRDAMVSVFDKITVKDQKLFYGEHADPYKSRYL